MADALARLVGPAGLGIAAVTVYTAPSAVGTYVVLRHIHVCNETAASAWVTISIGTDGANKRLWHRTSVGAYDNYDWTGNIVLGASEFLQAYSGTASALTATISGVVGP